MTPCIGCIKRKEMNMGITGNYWMKFIGKPDGVLMKGAPGNFIHGQKYKVPYGHAKWPFWELLEEVPVLEVSEDMDDSVFEEPVYIPDEPVPEVTVSEPVVEEVTPSAPIPEIDMSTHTPMIIDGVDYSPDAPATIEPHGTFSPMTGEVGDHKQELVEKNREPEPVPLTRKELLQVLSEADVEVKKGTRTTTLQKMVDKLEEAKE